MGSSWMEKTATMAYFIVRAPERLIRDGTFTQEEVEEVSKKIASRFMAGTHGGLVRYCSLISKERAPGQAADDGFDVMVLLGGFSLKKLLSASFGKFKSFSENLGGSGGSLEVRDDDKPSIRSVLTATELEKIEAALRDYSKKTEDLILKAKRRESSEDELDGWMKGPERAARPASQQAKKSGASRKRGGK